MRMPLDEVLGDLRKAAAETMEIPDLMRRAERARSLSARPRARQLGWVAGAGALMVALVIAGGILHWYRTGGVPAVAPPSHPPIYMNGKRLGKVPVRMYLPDVKGYTCGTINYTPASSPAASLSEFWVMTDTCARGGRPASGQAYPANDITLMEDSNVTTVAMTHTQRKRIGQLTVEEGSVNQGGQMLNGLYFQYGSTTFSYRPWTISGGKFHYGRPKLRTSSVSIFLSSRAPMHVLEEFARSMRLLKP